MAGSEALVYDAIRTPRGRGKSTGSLYEVKPVTLVVTLIEEMRRRFTDLDLGRLDDLVLGCVTPIGDQGADIAKVAAIAAGLPDTTGGVQLNRFCASGLEAVNQAAQRVRSGWEDLIFAGGVESMSRVPMASDGGAWAMDPETAFATDFVPQGIGADLIATLGGWSRTDVDTYAAESQARAAKAEANGYFARSVVPVKDRNGLTVLDHEEYVRPGTTVEALGALKPSFAGLGEAGGFDAVALEKYHWVERIRHVHTAGNSSGIVDGAALVAIGSAAIGEAAGIAPRARILATAVSGSDPLIMLTGPAPAARKALDKAGLSVSDIDLFEMNEAFAGVVLRFMADLGPGMMGAGIAHVCARAGMEVVLKDVSMQAAEKGKGYSTRLLDRQVDRGRLSSEQGEEISARITPAEKPADLTGCDLVIEAVFEDEGLKHRVFAEIEDVVEPTALLCSNTSTLPITGLATGVHRQSDFVGLHFFSPVEKMPLVEIIVGEHTSDEAIAKAYDVVRQIKKTPIVVNDSRGFFTSRVFGTLVMEGAAMLGEGVHPATIERAATSTGFPAPPLAMLDELSLTLPQKIRDEARAAAGSADGFAEHPGMAVIDRMVCEFDRRGKAAGAGFYDYPADGSKRLWSGLVEHFGCSGAPVSDDRYRDLKDRLTFAMSLETVKCLAEGVLLSTADANLGSIFGIGFPPLFGGALQYVNSYPGGLAGFADRARQLAAAYGDRFCPPPPLLEKAAAGHSF